MIVLHLGTKQFKAFDVRCRMRRFILKLTGSKTREVNSEVMCSMLFGHILDTAPKKVLN